MENYCISCGAEIPEGRLVCPSCRERADNRATVMQCVLYRHVIKKLTKTEEKYVCKKCRYAFDRQAQAFLYCPGCGRQVIEIEEAK